MRLLLVVGLALVGLLAVSPSVSAHLIHEHPAGCAGKDEISDYIPAVWVAAYVQQFRTDDMSTWSSGIISIPVICWQ